MAQHPAPINMLHASLVHTNSGSLGEDTRVKYDDLAFNKAKKQIEQPNVVVTPYGTLVEKRPQDASARTAFGYFDRTTPSRSHIYTQGQTEWNVDGALRSVRPAETRLFGQM